MQTMQKILTILLFLAALATVCCSWMLFDQREIFKERMRTLESHVHETATLTKWGDFAIQPAELRDRPDLLGDWPYESRSERVLLDRTLQDYSRMHQPLEILRGVIADRQQTLESNKYLLDRRQLEVQDSESRLFVCSQDLERSKHSLRGLEASLEVKKDEVRARLASISRLEGELIQLKSQHLELEDKTRACEVRLAGSEVALSDANREIADLLQVLATKKHHGGGNRGGHFAISAVEQDWQFIVIPLQPDDSLTPAAEGLIHRDAQLIGKAVVSRVEETYAIAQLKGDWQKDVIRPGDEILF